MSQITASVYFLQTRTIAHRVASIPWALAVKEATIFFAQPCLLWRSGT